MPPPELPLNEKLNYVEFPAVDLPATKQFFSSVFQWQFTDYGPDYIAFGNAGFEGGFYHAELKCRVASGGALLVFYSRDLESIKSKIVAAGGQIIQPIFEFPGGRRFHFSEPSGNEFAVWSDIPEPS